MVSTCHDDIFDRIMHHAEVSLWATSISGGAVNSLQQLSFLDAVASPPEKVFTATQIVLDRGLREVDEADSDGRTALMIASEKGYADVVTLLLNNGASPRRQDTVLRTIPINFAASRGHCAVVSALVRRCSPVTFPDSDGNTALHHAAAGGYVACIKTLLASGANISHRNAKEQTPLHVAAEMGCLESCGALVSQGSEITAVDAKGHTPVAIAVRKQFTTITTMLSEQPNFKKCVNALDKQSRTPVHSVCQFGPASVLTLLLQHGGDIHARDACKKNPLHYATYHNQFDCVKLLLEKDPSLIRSVDDRNSNPVHCAAEGGAVEALTLTLSAGGDVGHRNLDGFVPLHHAAQSNSDVCVQLLCAAPGAAPVDDAHPVSLTTPLHYACLHSAAKSAKALIEHGANPLAQTVNGNTPMIFACDVGCLAIAEILIDLAKTEQERVDMLRTANHAGQSVFDLCANGSGAPDGRQAVLKAVTKTLGEAEARLQALREHEAAEAAAEAERARLAEEASSAFLKRLAAEKAGGEVQRRFTAEALKTMGDDQIATKRKEEYLSDEDFENLFGCKKDVYRKWPERRKEARKQQLGLA